MDIGVGGVNAANQWSRNLDGITRKIKTLESGRGAGRVDHGEKIARLSHQAEVLRGKISLASQQNIHLTA